MPEKFASVSAMAKDGMAQFIEPTFKKPPVTQWMREQQASVDARKQAVMPGYKMVTTNKETLNQTKFY